MKKILTSLFIIFLSCSAIYAQKIEHDKINSLEKRIMYTDWQKINWQSKDYKLQASMLLEGNDMSIMLNWQCNEMVGAERDSEIVLLFDDQTEVILFNKTFSVSGAGKVRTPDVSGTVMGIQLDAKGDFRTIIEKTLVKITINTTSGPINFPITREEANKLADMYDIFEKQFFKNREK